MSEIVEVIQHRPNSLARALSLPLSFTFSVYSVYIAQWVGGFCALFYRLGHAFASSIILVTAHCYPFQPTEECGLRVFGSPSRKRNLIRFWPPAFLLLFDVHFTHLFSLSLSHSYVLLLFGFSFFLPLEFCSCVWLDIQPTHFYAHFLPIQPAKFN